MKHWVFFVILIVIISVGSALIIEKHDEKFEELKLEAQSKNFINFYQWEEYIPEDVIDNFEAEYDIEVNLITFGDEIESKNEIIENHENYDLFVATDILVKDLISLNLLEKIDLKNIDNLKNVDQRFLNLDFDKENNYSIPYAYGTTGIIYNKKYFENAPNISSFWDAKYINKSAMLAESDIYLLYLAKYNSIENIAKNFNEYEKIKTTFEKQKNEIIFGNYEKIRDMLISEEIWFGTNYESEYFLGIEENGDLEYTLPNGSLLWIDSMVIPKGAKNKESAETFMNYLLRPEVSSRIMEYSYTLTPVKGSIDLIDDERLIEHEKLIEHSNLFIYSEHESNYLYDKLKIEVEKFLEERTNE